MSDTSESETRGDSRKTRRGLGKRRRSKPISDVKVGWSDVVIELTNLHSKREPEQDDILPPPTPMRSPALTKKIDAELLTFDQLEERIGHLPHSDRLKGLWKRSVHYKEMRGETKKIENACKESLADLDAAALTKTLQALIKAGEDYAKQHKSDPDRVSVGNDVAARARDRHELLKAVTSDPDFDKVKDHITIEQALDCKAKAIRFKDCAFGTLNDDNASDVDDGFGSGNANSVSKIEFNDGDVRVFKAEKLRDDNPLDGTTLIGIDKDAPHNGNRNIATNAVSGLLGLDVTPKVEYGLHKNPDTDEVEVGLMMGLASGKPPARGTWQAWKPPSPGSSLGDLVQSANNGNQAALQELLKKKLRPDPLGGGAWQRQVTKLMPPWGDTPPSPKAQAALMEQLSGLEWCDILTGQTDRHAQNYFVEVNGDDVKVTGIDNDMAFGKNQTKASVTQREIDARRTPPGLPPLIDRKVYDELAGKTFAGDLLPNLQGLLTEDEIEATRQRFEEAQEHARKLEQDGYVIDDWASWESPDEQLSAREYLAKLNTEAQKNMRDATATGGLFGRDFAQMFDEAGL